MHQKLTLVGNLGKDPEMRYTEAGTPVTNMSLATNRTYTKDGQQVKETTWFRISVWGKQAEACQQYLSKGRQILVEGRLVTDENGNPRVWQRNDGTWAASFEVNADTVRFLGTGNGQAETETEEIPF
nr:single-stranded DNA-binding protein [Anaerolineae bacterium]